MKGLREFEKFDIERFLKGKKLAVALISEHVDFETKKHLGSKVKVAIIEDTTNYGNKGDKTISNLYESITLKSAKDVDLPVNTVVTPVNATASVYGEFHNQLSVFCDDVVPVNGMKGGSNA